MTERRHNQAVQLNGLRTKCFSKPRTVRSILPPSLFYLCWLRLHPPVVNTFYQHGKRIFHNSVLLVENASFVIYLEIIKTFIGLIGKRPLQE